MFKKSRTRSVNSMLADVVASHNKEELAIVFMFIDKDKNIREAFGSFLLLKRISWVYIAETIVSHLKKSGLELNGTKYSRVD